MSLVVSVLLVLGVVLLAAGYVKNNRNVLLVAGIVLLAAAVLPDFAAGFSSGADAAAHAGGK